MRIFIDESGSFCIPASPEHHAAAVVVGVVVPEVSQDALFGKYARFVASLASGERKNGEPKGSCLSADSRRRFCEMVAATPGLIVMPTTLDLSELSGNEARLNRLADALRESVGKCIYEEMRDYMATLAKRTANLSPQELLKLLLYAVCVEDCIQHAVLYRSEPPYRDCWSNVEIVIDRGHKKPDSREKQVFDFMLLSWLTAWSKRRPLVTIEEIHTADHPFVKNFDTGTGIDMRKLVGNGMRWADSRDESGLQVADIAAAIVSSAVYDLKNWNGHVAPFVALMGSSTRVNREGPGLVTVMKDSDGEHGEKYSGLVRALQAKYPNRTGIGLRKVPGWAPPKPL